METDFSNVTLYIGGNELNWRILSLFSRCKTHWPRFIPVHNDPALIAVVANLARDHFHRHANHHILAVQVGQLGGDHRAFV